MARVTRDAIDRSGASLYRGVKRLCWIGIGFFILGCAASTADDDDAGGGPSGRSCANSPIVGEWAPAALPTAAVLDFDSDCVFLGNATGDCGNGTVRFRGANANSGQLTLEVNGVHCQTCEYDVNDDASPRTMDFGCPDIDAEFVEVD